MTLPVGYVRGTQEALADASREADGATFTPATGMIQAVDSPPLTIYVQSPYNGTIVQPNGGDDKFAEFPIGEIAGNFGRRLRSWHGIERILKRATYGRTIEIVLCGDAPGDDPESATELRVYTTRRIQLGGGESGRVPVTYRGPKNWLPLTNVSGPLVNIQFLGGAGAGPVNTRAIFPAATFGTDLRGWWMPQEANGSGRMVYFPIPIRKNDDHQIWIDAQLGGADLNGDVVPGNTHNSFVTPAALIEADDFGSKVLIEGYGTPEIGCRGTTNVALDNPQNIPFSFRQLHLVGIHVNATGQCVFDRCLLDDSPVFHHGTIGFYSCITIQSVVLQNTRGTWPTIMNQLAETVEPCGQPEVFGQPLPPNANPIVPYNGTNLLCHGVLQIGNQYQGRGEARLVIQKALSVAPSPIEGSVTSHVDVRNPGSCLYISNNGAAYIESDGGSGPAVWCKMDSSARIPFAASTIVDGGQGALMVGRDTGATPPITPAALAAAPYNGRFQRPAATTLDSGNDQSYIISSAWDTVDPTYNNGL